ncbi:MAG TPA: hypothetical protein VFS00_08400 [Polyangiaceae bacterium]|nr:hypothetical protein [Polyangiaceae bacterium]
MRGADDRARRFSWRGGAAPSGRFFGVPWRGGAAGSGRAALAGLALGAAGFGRAALAGLAPGAAGFGRAALAGLALGAAALGAGAGCGGDDDAAAEPPTCDQACKDGAAMRGLRETLKFAFNLTVQGRPPGEHDRTVACAFGGTVRVHGRVTAEAEFGSNDVNLTYELTDCAALQYDEEAPDNYNYQLAFTGVVLQQGTMAVQPTAKTVLYMSSAALSFSGTVNEPPLAYEEPFCTLTIAQTLENVLGNICERQASFLYD